MKKKWGSLKNKLWNLVDSHRIITIILAAILVAATGFGLYYYSTKDKPTSNTSTSTTTLVPTATPMPVSYYSPLTGNKVDSEAATHQAVTGIMIENSPDARPQSGLKDSGVVFEAIAEGGITRFLAIYQEQKPQLIGPVRSVRIYYVNWIAAFNASVAHIGGSAAALAEVRNGSYRDIDQFFNSGSYWRATDRNAPHNVYTSFAKLDALNQKKGYTTSDFTGFTRKDSEASPVATATQINVTMSSALFNSAYSYDKASNTYLRSEGGAPHMDREQGQISPRVVIVMKVPMSTVLEDGYRQDYSVIGNGTAYIFQDGNVAEATWTKSSKKEQIKFTDATGQEIALARGQVFITAVPAATGGVTWK